MDDKPDAEDDEIYYCGTGYGYVTEETSSILKRLPKSGLTEIRYHYRDGDGEASGAERWRPSEGWEVLSDDNIFTFDFKEAAAIDHLLGTGEGLKEIVTELRKEIPMGQECLSGALGQGILVAKNIDLDDPESNGITWEDVDGFVKWILDTFEENDMEEYEWLADKTERLSGFATRAMVALEGEALANEARSPGATTAGRRI